MAVFPSDEGITVLGTDITDKKNAEDALRKARIEWERTFDALPDYIAIIDHKHRILRVNKAMADKLGMRPEQFFGMRCYGCVHKTDKSPTDCPHSKSIEDGKVHVAELFEERLGGDLIVTTTPLYDEKGKIFATIHVAKSARSK
jgi:PAS domain S-box-containing protein